MIFVLCIDDKNGLSFNGRRQSRDRVLIDRLIRMLPDKTINIKSYSSPLFEKYIDRVNVSEELPDKLKNGEVFFSENLDPAPFKDSIEKLILFKWNRVYPSDKKMTLELSDFSLINSKDFTGSSHDKITVSEYTR